MKEKRRGISVSPNVSKAMGRGKVTSVHQGHESGLLHIARQDESFCVKIDKASSSSAVVITGCPRWMNVVDDVERKLNRPTCGELKSSSYNTRSLLLNSSPCALPLKASWNRLSESQP